MINLFLFIPLVLVHTNLFAMSEECLIDVFVIKKDRWVYEMGIENKSEHPFEIRLDRLPWVIGYGGVYFDIYIDGKRVVLPFGAGHSTEIIIIGKKSRVSSNVNVSYLQSFYSGVDSSRVLITWNYRLVEGGGKGCRKSFSGVIDASG